MKILHLVGQREDFGGILSVIRSLQHVSPVDQYQHSVWVHNDYAETRSPALDYRRGNFVISDSPSHLAIFLTSALAFFGLRRLAKREAFDVIHAHTRGGLVVALLIAWLMRRPVLFTNHTFANRTGFYRWVANRKRMTTVLLNPAMAAHYEMAIEEPHRWIVFSGCADRFLEVPLGSSAWSSAEPEAKLRLVGMGSVVRWKGWHLPIQALAKLPPEWCGRVEFHLWGPEQQDADAQAFVKELNAFIVQNDLQQCVFLHGPTNKVVESLQSGHFVVVASENEPCSVSLMESLALGLPALAARSGGNVDIVKDEETGVLFENGSAEDLKDKLVAILSGGIALRPSAEIRESVRGWAASAMTEKYNRIYDHMAQLNSAGS
jgi:glycosyltransferase involved in cell wall biosynthesis